MGIEMTVLRGELGGSQHPRRHYFSRYNVWLKLPGYNIEPDANESNLSGRRKPARDLAATLKTPRRYCPTFGKLRPSGAARFWPARGCLQVGEARRLAPPQSASGASPVERLHTARGAHKASPGKLRNRKPLLLQPPRRRRRTVAQKNRRKECAGKPRAETRVAKIPASDNSSRKGPVALAGIAAAQTPLVKGT